MLDKLNAECYDNCVGEVKNLKKTLYSLMLNEEVVREVDALAHRLGTNRSNLINQILAEYVDYITPERRINEVFEAIEKFMRPSRELVACFAPNAPTISMKSSLEYKYRPTVKYEVELYHPGEKNLGELSVVFRTQSSALLAALADFFRLWKHMEDIRLGDKNISYAAFEGKFMRSILLPQVECSAEELAAAISDYIQLFDKALKGCLAGRLDAADVDELYVKYIRQQKILI